MAVRHNKAPFPWFGGKSKAASKVWELLGDVSHYVEPFAGALGVLLERPHPCNRAYYSETINDLDGLVVNAWRAIQLHPDETAEHASWPVTEADKIARQVAVVRWRAEVELEHLMGSPEWCDPQMAGWWLYGVCCQIGAVDGRGPWTVDPKSGRLYKQPVGTREPGVARDRPDLGNDGMGVNHARTREPGVARDLPHLTGGMGVNRPQLREPGVARGLPHLGDGGMGVNHAGTREPGVRRNLPHLSGGMGVNHPGTREPGVESEEEFHPVTMPELRRWFAWLSARLRHVRIVNGDWKRVCTSGAAKTLTVRMGKSPAGIFLDPPYSNDERAGDLYHHDCGAVAKEVLEWCKRNGDDPLYRIVLAGYDVEHAELTAMGWTEHEWFKAGHLTGGMGNVGGEHQQDRERLWASPHCLAKEPERLLF